MLANFNENERKILLFSALAHGYTHFYMTIFTATNIIMAAEFGLSISNIGDIGFISFALFGFGALASGFIIAKIAAKNSILLSLAGGTLFTLFTAFAPNVFWLTVCLAGMGAFGSIYHPAGLTLVANTIRSRGRGLGLHGIGGTLGLALAPMLAGFITANLSWRWAYGLLSIPGFVILGFGLLSKIDEIVLEGETLTKNIKKKLNNKRRNFTHPGIFLALVFAMQISFGLFFTGTTIFLPTYASRSINIEFLGLAGIAMGGFFTTISLLAGIGGQIIGGEASEKFKLYKLQFFVMLFSVPIIFMIGLATNYLLILSMMLFSLFAFSWQPIGNGLVAYYTPLKWRGHIFGLSFALSFGVGSFASSIAGRVAEHFGMNRIFLVMGLIGLLAFLFSIPLWILNHRAEK